MCEVEERIMYIINIYGVLDGDGNVGIVDGEVLAEETRAEIFYEDQCFDLGTRHLRVELLKETDDADPEIISAQWWTQDDYDNIDDDDKDNYINPSLLSGVA